MEEKTKVALLGLNHQKISSVVDKINGTRPVEGVVFTNLKEFLVHCVEHKPDIVGFSVSFPHKSVAQFPNVFKMALGVQVIIFGENQDPKTRKLLGSMQADFKISGLITAHNLWMKIISCQKAREDDVASSGGSMADNNNSNLGNAVHLKGGNEANKTKDKNSLLNSLLAGLGEPSSSQVPNVNQVQSSKGETEGKSLSSSTEREKQEKNISVEPGSAADQASGFSKDKSLGVLMSGGAPEATHSESEQNKKPLQKNNNENTKPGTGSNTDLENKQKDLSNNLQKNEPEGSKSNQDRKKTEQKEPQENQQRNSLPEKGEQAPENEFGSVKLSKAEDLKSAELEKQKKVNAKDVEKNKSILVEACKKALTEVFGSENLSETKMFKNTKLYTLIVEMAGFKGYLMVATSSKQDLETLRLKDFRSTVFEYVTNQGASIEISSDFSIDEKIEDYPLVSKNFCEFTIHSSNKIGQHVHVSFVSREAVWPKFESSDKEKMYFVDIKVIPPHTKVNFDAFLYLPKNKKFVRYLKEGRSLSLEQAKRHTQTAAKSKFYLPYEHKNNFIKFFIQNTIKWEFALHKEKKDVA